MSHLGEAVNYRICGTKDGVRQEADEADQKGFFVRSWRWHRQGRPRRTRVGTRTSVVLQIGSEPPLAGRKGERSDTSPGHKAGGGLAIRWAGRGGRDMGL